uniref:Uncharacterized protein n=1 Tax=Rhizophora mucronata TaxID=61149 RepID=A0A2P2PRY3_RHIMU
MELFRIIRNHHFPFSQRSHCDPSHSREWAARGHLVPVEGCANKEDTNRNSKANSWKPISQSPAHIVL